MLPLIQISETNPFRVLDKIEEKSDHLQFKSGQLIYCEGSTPLGAYFVQKGKVKISRLGSDGKEQIMKIAGPEEILSYTDLIGGSRYGNSAKALEDTSVLFLPRQEFWEFLKSNINLLQGFVQLLSLDLKQAELKITDLAYKPVRGRLADALIYLSRKFNLDDMGTPFIAITRYDLASYVGTAKETVNRLLSELRNESIISTEGTKIFILDKKGLKRLSDLYE